jgi:hypothetical protein
MSNFTPRLTPAPAGGPASTDDNTTTQLYSAAVKCLEVGLSVIPTDPGTKSPVIRWKKYTTQLPTSNDLTLWFMTKNFKAFGIVCGAVSGGLKAIDFDHLAEFYDPWVALVEEEAPGLTSRLVVQKTQNNGRHVGYRCPEFTIPGNQKLAVQRIDVTDKVLSILQDDKIDPADRRAVRKKLPSIGIEIAGKRFVPLMVEGGFVVTPTMIETRGEGGQFLAAPSPGYELLQGDFAAAPIISAEERQILINAALALNEFVDPNQVEGTGHRRPKGTGRPGDAFNETGDVVVLLEKRKWKHVGENNIYQHWRRPGKALGQSASLINGKIFKVFSENASPFEAGKAYSPFAVYTMLEHDGDYSAAARELSKQGYGQRAASEDSPPGAHPYWIRDHAIGYDKHTQHGSTPVRLTNFTARIVGEVFKDDGAETKYFFVIAGADQEGRPYHQVEVPAQQFSSLSWVTGNWGNGPVVYAGQAIKDHVRCAIQLLSGEVPQRTVYGHLGWRRINGEWLYLHCGGAIGANGPVAGVEVILSSSQMQCYSLPPPPSGESLRQAVKASLGLRILAPPQRTYPLMCATYRAPLGECAHIDLSLLLAGQTGVFKTELTAMAQSHYGAEFNGRNLPGNWTSTSNSLEYQAFLTKDAVFTVDDFAPRGTVFDIQRFHKKADRLLRGQANRAGRGRMHQKGGLRPEYFPRGLIISSGEDIPTGQSLRARTVILEVKPGDVDLVQLTLAQQAAADGLYAQAMGGYLQYLAPRIEALKRALPVRQRELRDVARREGVTHDRTPEIWASLAVGFEQFLKFALDIGAITETERQELFKECWEALRQASRAQDAHQRSEDPTGRFLALLGAAIASGKAHIADSNTLEEPKRQADQWGWREKTIGTGDYQRQEWQPQGDRVGWLDGDNLLLEPDAAFAMVQRFGRDQGTSLPLTQRSLWKRMADKGLLASRELSQNRNQVRWPIGGERLRVIHIKTSVLRTENLDRFSGNFQETVQENGPETQEWCDPGPIGPKGPFMEDNKGHKIDDGAKNLFQEGEEITL